MIENNSFSYLLALIWVINSLVKRNVGTFGSGKAASNKDLNTG
jgi:hypothetical protein